MRRSRLLLAVAASVVAVGVVLGFGPVHPFASAATGGSAPRVLSVGTVRPAQVVVPAGPAKARPLVLVLHGYGSSGAAIDRYLRLRAAAAARGVVLAFPDGTLENGNGNRFWNATNNCCDFYNSGVDDSAYLASLVDAIAQQTPIDRARVYAFGHSNGGFMAYRLACDHADTFAAVAVLAGATFADKARCAPSKPVSVLSINGTADYIVNIAGGPEFDPYPSTATSLRYWASYDGCGPNVTLRRTGTLHLLATGTKRETTTFSSRPCPAGVNVDFWRMAGAPHSPNFNTSFGPDVLAWLLRHHR